jgi:hypothetical protein
MRRCALWALTRGVAKDCLLPLSYTLRCSREQIPAAASVFVDSGSTLVRCAHKTSAHKTRVKRIVLVHPRCLDPSYLDEAQSLIQTAHGIRCSVISTLQLVTLVVHLLRSSHGLAMCRKHFWPVPNKDGCRHLCAVLSSKTSRNTACICSINWCTVSLAVCSVLVLCMDQLRDFLCDTFAKAHMTHAKGIGAIPLATGSRQYELVLSVPFYVLCPFA